MPEQIDYFDNRDYQNKMHYCKVMAILDTERPISDEEKFSEIKADYELWKSQVESIPIISLKDRYSGYTPEQINELIQERNKPLKH